MRNPWLRKNPWLSMWMSGANAALGAARGRAAVEARRQASNLAATSVRQVAAYWAQAMSPELPRKKNRAR